MADEEGWLVYGWEEMDRLPLPTVGVSFCHTYVKNNLGHLVCDLDVGEPSPAFRGGQTAADGALARFDVTGYATRRNEAYPVSRRGASKLSPWVRHGLLSLADLWRHVAGGPPVDVAKFRDELLWQEYARHWYARLGAATRHPQNRRMLAPNTTPMHWDRRMGCIDAAVDELEEDGWLVNQLRLWLSSHWTVRHERSWRRGEDYFFTHLLDGSRAANRLGWQWATGVGSSKPYGFSRWQVEKWAAGLCASCELAHDCPIEQWPTTPPSEELSGDGRLDAEQDRSASAGPYHPMVDSPPEVVWITAESMGDCDPALEAHPEVPVVFIFDEALLRRLQLSVKRFVFLTETLADLAERRDLEVWLGDPVEVLKGRSLAATYTPVPGWKRRSSKLKITACYPWPWLTPPHEGSVRSFSAWRRRIENVPAS